MLIFMLTYVFLTKLGYLYMFAKTGIPLITSISPRLEEIFKGEACLRSVSLRTDVIPQGDVVCLG